MPVLFVKDSLSVQLSAQDRKSEIKALSRSKLGEKMGAFQERIEELYHRMNTRLRLKDTRAYQLVSKYINNPLSILSSPLFLVPLLYFARLTHGHRLIRLVVNILTILVNVCYIAWTSVALCSMFALCFLRLISLSLFFLSRPRMAAMTARVLQWRNMSLVSRFCCSLF